MNDFLTQELADDFEVLRAERDALAFEVAELHRREQIREQLSLSSRIYGAGIPTNPSEWNWFDLTRVLSCLHMAFEIASTSDLPHSISPMSDTTIISNAMREVLTDFLNRGL